MTVHKRVIKDKVEVTDPSDGARILANKVLAIGIGNTEMVGDELVYKIDNQLMSAGLFVSDWRTAGAVMEKLGYLNVLTVFGEAMISVRKGTPMAKAIVERGVAEMERAQA